MKDSPEAKAQEWALSSGRDWHSAKQGYLAGYRQAIEDAAKVSDEIEGYWFDCDIPSWLAKSMGIIAEKIRALYPSQPKKEAP